MYSYGYEMYSYCYVCSVLGIVSLCCSVYCLCVNVYCTTANGCQPNCSSQLYHIPSLQPLSIQISILFLEQYEHSS